MPKRQHRRKQNHVSHCACTLQDCYLIYLGTVMVSGQEYIRLPRTLSPWRDFPFWQHCLQLQENAQRYCVKFCCLNLKEILLANKRSRKSSIGTLKLKNISSQFLCVDKAQNGFKNKTKTSLPAPSLTCITLTPEKALWAGQVISFKSNLY